MCYYLYFELNGYTNEIMECNIFIQDVCDKVKG